MSIQDSAPKGNPAPNADAAPKSTLETAAEMLRQFTSGRNFASSRGDTADNRTILLASMLLANAQQLERIADALETQNAFKAGAL